MSSLLVLVPAHGERSRIAKEVGSSLPGIVVRDRIAPGERPDVVVGFGDAVSGSLKVTEHWGVEEPTDAASLVRVRQAIELRLRLLARLAHQTVRAGD